MRFVQLDDTVNVQTGGRSGTPILEMPNITKGNTIMVTVTFMARTHGGDGTSGFTYTIQPTKEADAKVLSNQTSMVQGTNHQFITTTKTVFFEAIVSSPTGVEEVDFEVVFQNSGMDGAGEISAFLMTGAVVSLANP